MTIDFPITSHEAYSSLVKKEGFNTFLQIAHFIKNLPYGRTSDPSNPQLVFSEKIGTCSSKHVFLARIVEEHQRTDISLRMGVFAMNATNRPPVAALLKQHQLPYLPQAHCYFRWDGQIYDFTASSADPKSFESLILEEKEVSWQEVIQGKTLYHKAFLKEWMKTLPETWTLENLWHVRENCIAALSHQNKKH